jgi:hypothetical protein
MYSFFLLKTFLSQLLLLSYSLVTTQSRRKANRQITMITIPLHLPLSGLYWNFTRPHLPPLVQIVAEQTNVVAVWYLQFPAHRPRLLSLAAAAMATTCLQYQLSLIHRLHVYQHWRRMLMSSLFLHQGLTLTPRLAAPLPKGFELGWISIVSTHRLSHVPCHDHDFFRDHY